MKGIFRTFLKFYLISDVYLQFVFILLLVFVTEVVVVVLGYVYRAKVCCPLRLTQSLESWLKLCR